MTHILRVNCAKIAVNSPRQPAHEIFCVKRISVDFIDSSPDPLGSRRFAQAGIEEEYPLKMAILPLFACLAYKLLQIGTNMLLIITRPRQPANIGIAKAC